MKLFSHTKIWFKTSCTKYIFRSHYFLILSLYLKAISDRLLKQFTKRFLKENKLGKNEDENFKLLNHRIKRNQKYTIGILKLWELIRKIPQKTLMSTKLSNVGDRNGIFSN